MSFDCYLVITSRENGLLHVDRWLGRQGVMEEFEYVTKNQKPKLENEGLEVYKVTEDQMLEISDASYSSGPNREEIMEYIQKYESIFFCWQFVRK